MLDSNLFTPSMTAGNTAICEIAGGHRRHRPPLLCGHARLFVQSLGAVQTPAPAQRVIASSADWTITRSGL